MSKFLVCLNGDEISSRAFDQCFRLFQSMDIVNLLCVLNLQDYVLTQSQQEMLDKRKKQEILNHSVDYSTFVKANSQMIDKARYLKKKKILMNKIAYFFFQFGNF